MLKIILKSFLLHNKIFIFLSLFIFFTCSSQKPDLSKNIYPASWDPFLDTLQLRTLTYFLETTNPATGLSLDRWPTSYSPSSIAAVGFALTTYPISAERKLITRQEAATRVFNTLKFLYNLPQNQNPTGSAGYKGFFYHFVTLQDGTRTWNCELSSIDTALLLAGVLFCQSYFDANNLIEQEIRALADSLYLRVDWRWMMNNRNGITLGWTPENGFHPHIWDGYDEAMILYILALGSPTNPVPESVWDVWTKPYLWANFYGYEFISFAPLFGHQFSHCWIDFRGIQDNYMKRKGIDYFENSRRATYSQRAYAIDNPNNWKAYSDSIWGWTACDGPKDTTFVIDGTKRKFQTYAARGVSIDWTNDDGTIAPTAVGGSIAFAPEICIPALKAIRSKYDTLVFRKYGFIDSFNPTFRTTHTSPYGWFNNDYLGIDQGPIAIMIENLRNELVWNIMKKNPYIIKGLKRAGFKGGWLENNE